MLRSRSSRGVLADQARTTRRVGGVATGTFEERFPPLRALFRIIFLRRRPAPQRFGPTTEDCHHQNENAMIRGTTTCTTF